jgi:manganese/zinc/iron transport system permease protein
MSEMIPAFDWQRVVLDPWTVHFSVTFWIVLMGFFVNASCGMVGTFLLLRRMALIGDAISHSILFGLVTVFFLFKTVSTPMVFLGAVGAGLLTAGMIEFIHRQSRVKPDAAICIAFTTLFALGVVISSIAELQGSVHIDAECVLYGEIGFVPLEAPVIIGGISLGPPSVLRMGFVLLAVLVAIALFYKELLVTSFDPGFARSIGMKTGAWHYAIMAVLSVVIVSAFEAVGAILAIAMLVVPPMFAAHLAQRLPVRLVWCMIHAALASIVGYHLSLWLDCSTAGAMVVASAALFTAVWLFDLANRAIVPRGRSPFNPSRSPC